MPYRVIADGFVRTGKKVRHVTAHDSRHGGRGEADEQYEKLCTEGSALGEYDWASVVEYEVFPEGDMRVIEACTVRRG